MSPCKGRPVSYRDDDDDDDDDNDVSRLPAASLSRNDSGQVVHIRASLLPSRNRRRCCSAAAKVTAGLAESNGRLIRPVYNLRPVALTFPEA